MRQRSCHEVFELPNDRITPKTGDANSCLAVLRISTIIPNIQLIFNAHRIRDRLRAALRSIHLMQKSKFSDASFAGYGNKLNDAGDFFFTNSNFRRFVGIVFVSALPKPFPISRCAGWRERNEEYWELSRSWVLLCSQEYARSNIHIPLKSDLYESYSYLNRTCWLLLMLDNGHMTRVQLI